MSYDLAFLAPALKEWRKLDAQTREQFKAKLLERMVEPRIPASRLRGLPDRYKIKLRAAGFRLVYEVRDADILIVVIAVGRRNRNAVYAVAKMRDGKPVRED